MSEQMSDPNARVIGWRLLRDTASGIVRLGGGLIFYATLDPNGVTRLYPVLTDSKIASKHNQTIVPLPSLLVEIIDPQAVGINGPIEWVDP